MERGSWYGAMEIFILEILKMGIMKEKVYFHGQMVKEVMKGVLVKDFLKELVSMLSTLRTILSLGWLITNSGVFKGEFKEGFLNGKGSVIYKNGDEYSGYFQKSKINGPGCYKYANGNWLVGNFTNGFLWNQGKKIYAKSGKIYVGELINELENGKGMINNETYGIFKDGHLVEEVVYQ